MIVGDKFVYLQMQKTACTRIAEILQELVPCESVGRKHAGLDEKPKDKLVIGSIRNPWEWYVSLWAFGCEGRGGLYGKLKKFPKWRLLYGSVLNRNIFRLWLEEVDVHSSWSWQRGIMSYRYNLVYQGMVDAWVQVENMANDLGKALMTAGYAIPVKSLAYLCDLKSNISRHKHYSYYYDDETIELVRVREREIIAAHGYSYEQRDSHHG